MIAKFFETMRARARTELELRRFLDAELREIGVTAADIDAFLRRR